MAPTEEQLKEYVYKPLANAIRESESDRRAHEDQLFLNLDDNLRSQIGRIAEEFSIRKLLEKNLAASECLINYLKRFGQEGSEMSKVQQDPKKMD